MKIIMKYAGLVLVSLSFLVGGRAHFTSTQFFVSIVPPYVPLPLATVYVTGVGRAACAHLVVEAAGDCTGAR